jgi:hypothetical protein
VRQGHKDVQLKQVLPPRLLPSQRDTAGLAAVILAVGALLLYRSHYVEPRIWGATCAADAVPFACAPRAGLLWLQEYGLWGLGGLALGLWAFLGGPFASAVGAVALGAAGVINYNATFGMLGAALGGWAWVTRGSIRREPAATPIPEV